MKILYVIYVNSLNLRPHELNTSLCILFVVLLLWEIKEITFLVLPMGTYFEIVSNILRETLWLSTGLHQKECHIQKNSADFFQSYFQKREGLLFILR